MNDRRRVVGLVLVAVCVVLLPVSAAVDTSWLAAPLIVFGTLGLGLLIAVIVSPRDRR
ncbi:MAG TPA: hypothetical protein VGI54_09930 [Solirubrobacteraceae bacterium]